MVSPTVCARRCLSYLMSEMPQEALGDAMQALVISPEWPTALYLQATCLFSLGMENEAQDSLKDATSLETRRDTNWWRCIDFCLFSFSSCLSRVAYSVLFMILYLFTISSMPIWDCLWHSRLWFDCFHVLTSSSSWSIDLCQRVHSAFILSSELLIKYRKCQRAELTTRNSSTGVRIRKWGKNVRNTHHLLGRAWYSQTQTSLTQS